MCEQAANSSSFEVGEARPRKLHEVRVPLCAGDGKLFGGHSPASNDLDRALRPARGMGVCEG
jgi:hypothetical protein